MSVRSSITKLCTRQCWIDSFIWSNPVRTYCIFWTRYFEKNEPISMQIGTSGPREQGHETIDFRGQEVKGQGHRRPKCDLEAWRSHHSWPTGSSSRPPGSSSRPSGSSSRPNGSSRISCLCILQICKSVLYTVGLCADKRFLNFLTEVKKWIWSRIFQSCDFVAHFSVPTLA